MSLFRAAHRAEVVTAGLAVASLVLLALPDQRQQAIARGANHVLLLPLSETRGAFGGYLGLRTENRRLREELARARIELAASAAERQRARELVRLLGFASQEPVRLLPAQVIDRDFGTLPTTFVIDAGSQDGVRDNLPVVTPDGLVGKTVEVGPRSTQVMLYTHPDFSASALLLGGDHLEFGVIRPSPDGELQLFLPLRSHSEAGNRIVTSGYGGSFPRGIPLGQVVEVREDRRLGLQKIDLVEPVVDLARVSSVFVLRLATAEGGSVGDVPRLFWPGYAYPPMAGEAFGRRAAGSPDSTAGGASDSMGAVDSTAGASAPDSMPSTGAGDRP